MKLPGNLQISNAAPAALKQYLHQHSQRKVAVLVDENTLRYCYPLIKEVLPTHHLIQISSGEEHKTLHTCEQIWQELTNEGFGRDGLLINLGGGVIGDMGGFCAATYKRGIAFINLPTTLLSQVDASIGGKLGIDFGPYKNHIGLFSNPEWVLVSPSFLNTLDARELKSGFAEVIKHALISDADHWQVIRSKGFHEQDWGSHIPHSIHTKHQVVSCDPKEQGLRKILNFGHTLGHAIESYHLTSPYVPRLLHGEAIAIGMVCETFLSHRKLQVSEADLISVADYLIGTYGKVEMDKKVMDELCQFMLQDKKNRNQQVRASLLKTLGNCTHDVTISMEEAKEALFFYQDYVKNSP